MPGPSLDPDTPPTCEPSTHAVGDTLKFTRDFGDYSPDNGWSLEYYFSTATAALGSATASDNGDGTFLLVVSAATTAAWPAGRVDYQAFATKASERKRLAWGFIELEDNLAAGGAFDGRSHAQKVVDAIEAVLENRASKDQAAYAIGDRSLSRTPIPDLLKLRDSYLEEIKQERLRDERRKGGPGGKHRVLTSFR